jgi:hypothetical protein
MQNLVAERGKDALKRLWFNTMSKTWIEGESVLYCFEIFSVVYFFFFFSLFEIRRDCMQNLVAERGKDALKRLWFNTMSKTWIREEWRGECFILF